ncbi:cytochrome-c oxidase, cbb3-type subunit III [Roseovarius arcticus]|uniref:cytochrome-c oxidase, cbb3-type subunit III n=1 Tax=Roseovarius arcticus TaxID=2547404 RepID=UPI00111087CB|nr:cytochrome-c oxidase, cbb3-type subunit III [Roseovarius arcticus]
MTERKKDDVTGIETTGHSWDGIQELNTPLPRWWLWTLYLTIIWAIGYTIAYPAWPMISGATTGLMGWSTRANIAADIVAHEGQNADLVASLVSADMQTLPADADLNRYAIARGGAVFRANCSQCHGSGAAGAKGYPNLLDDDWLWGGDMAAIEYTVRHGIRNDLDDDARYSQMPAFGDILDGAQIDAVVEHVVSLSNAEFDGNLAGAGAVVFADNCAVCHGDAGLGDRELGAPNIADAIWLYGGDRAALHTTVEKARFGVMPPWGPRLSEADIRAVSAYVHSLGGGE